MVDYNSFEEFRDPLTYDLMCDSFNADYPLVEQWARTLGSPLLDLACGTGRMAIHLALLGYAVTGVDIVPEMIAHARRKAAERAVSIEWVVADARTFDVQKQFPFIFMLMNAFQFLLTREDYEAMLARVGAHLQPGGCFLFETRNPFRPLHNDHEQYTLSDGGQLVVTEQQRYDPLTQIQHCTSQLKFLHADGQVVEKTLRTALRYLYPQETEALLHYNGFRIRECYGNWQGEPLAADSPAMIYVCEKHLQRPTQIP